MNPVQHLARLFHYDHWANVATLASLKAHGVPADPALRRMNHVLGAQFTWFARLKQQAPLAPAWPEWTVGECESHTHELERLWLDYFRTLTPEKLMQPIAYRNSQGESFTNNVDDILMHVLLHSAYHRGQVAADIRGSGHAPANTDFIHAVRQGFVQEPRL